MVTDHQDRPGARTAIAMLNLHRNAQTGYERLGEPQGKIGQHFDKGIGNG